MKALVAISTPRGAQILTVTVDDFDPFAVLTIGDTTVALTREECRKVADALRAAALREPHAEKFDEEGA